MNKVKPIFRAKIGASEKSAEIIKIWCKKLFFCNVSKANKILGKLIKFQVNTISLSKVMRFFIRGREQFATLPGPDRVMFPLVFVLFLIL